jgi:hypothetical protein
MGNYPPRGLATLLDNGVEAMSNKAKAIALLSARIQLESNRRYRSSYEQECYDELIEIRRLLRARS